MVIDEEHMYEVKPFEITGGSEILVTKDMSYKLSLQVIFIGK